MATVIQPQAGVTVIEEGPQPPQNRCCHYATAILSFLTGGGTFLLGIIAIATLPNSADNWAKNSAIGIWMGAIIAFTGKKLFSIPLSLFTQSCCKLVTTPERRGKVVYVGDETDGFDVTLNSKDGYQAWIRNFFAYQRDFAMSFWMKRIFTNVKGASEKILISTNLWRVTYNGHLGTVKWGIGLEHDWQGSYRMVLTCNVDDFRQWNYFAIAGSGVNTDVPGILDAPASLYMNGKLCEGKSRTKLGYKVNTKENAKNEYTKINFFLKNVGHAMFDELKFFKSYPASSAVIKTMYESERKKLME